MARVLQSPLNPQSCRNKKKIIKKGHFYFLRQTLVYTKPWFKRHLTNHQSIAFSERGQFSQAFGNSTWNEHYTNHATPIAPFESQHNERRVYRVRIAEFEIPTAPKTPPPPLETLYVAGVPWGVVWEGGGGRKPPAEALQKSLDKFSTQISSTSQAELRDLQVRWAAHAIPPPTPGASAGGFCPNSLLGHSQFSRHSLGHSPGHFLGIPQKHSESTRQSTFGESPKGTPVNGQLAP